ncbi:hypothetical protein [Streptomyces shaanxiensis]|uniref:hypothetical protein n=1 Tax=Streptomyces shaanxiensis TaxID=653357 RepID=UPI0031F11423
MYTHTGAIAADLGRARNHTPQTNSPTISTTVSRVAAASFTRPYPPRMAGISPREAS